MRISNILRDKSSKVVSVNPGTAIHTAVTLMKNENVGALVVLDANNLLGVVSERDLVLGLFTHGTHLLGKSVRAVMNADSPVATPNDSIIETMKVMTERRARHLPVVENGVVIGLVSIGDVTKYRLVEKVEENNVLQDIARIRLAVA
jgi:CBS domain-containing protein